MHFPDFAPATKAEAAQATGTAAQPGPAPSAAPDASAPVAAVPAALGAIPAPAVKPEPPRFVGGRLRVLEVELDYPLEYDGVLFEAITLRRPTSAEVGRYFERLAEVAVSDPDAILYFPVFTLADGAEVPGAVLEALDPDDRERVMELAEDFLPGRLLRFRDAQRPASSPPAGDSTEQTSST